MEQICTLKIFINERVPTSMTIPVPDNVNINLNINELKDLNIKYIFDNQRLQIKEFGLSFTEIYQDNDTLESLNI